MSTDSLKVLFEGIKHPVDDPVVLSKCMYLFKLKICLSCIQYETIYFRVKFLWFINFSIFPTNDLLLLGIGFLSKFNLSERELLDHWEAFSLTHDKVKPSLNIM